MAVQKKVDVVTLGAGWSAGVMAYKLTQAGYQVLSLEQGPARWANPDYAHNHDALRYKKRKAMMVNLGQETWTWRPNPGVPALPMRHYGAFQPGSGLGGSGVHWSAQYFRYTETDFRLRSYYTERYGKGFLPDGMSIQDWPLSYAELEPYYDTFDYNIGASGQVGNLGGQIVEGGNPFEGPRSRPYPLPPLVRSIPSLMWDKASRELGYHPFTQPSAILSEAYQDISGRTRSGCLYCGYCTWHGCEVDAKASAPATYIPVALQTGRYDLRPNCKVTKINLAADGRATGLTYLDLLTGEEHEQPADLVILSGYTLSNVKLLLSSRNSAHPNGVGNDRKQVGRNCTHQMWVNPVRGVFKGRKFNLYMGNTCTQTALYDFYEGVLDVGDLGFANGTSVFCALGEREPVMTATQVPGVNGRQWGRGWKEALRDWDGTVPVWIEGSSPSYTVNRYDLDPTYKDEWGNPVLRLTFDWQDNEKKAFRFYRDKTTEIMRAMNPTSIHPQEELSPYNMNQFYGTHNTGGAIMGVNPGDSVTNSYGQVWDTPNVFVTGAALWPQNPGANPTGTVGAMALRTGDALVKSYFKSPDELLG